MTRGAQRAGWLLEIGSTVTLSFHFFATLLARARHWRSRRASTLGSSSRISWSRTQRSGTMLETPGPTSTRPKLVTLLPLPFVMISRRARRAYSAAAMKASRRQAMGVVPAWSAWPLKVTQLRRLPTMPSTTPMGIFAASRCGPCSMCSST